MTTLLTIDDEISINIIMQSYFERRYHVVSVNNGLEGLRWLEEGGQPDAVIADLNMPEMDGLEFIRALKGSEVFSHIPLIVLSSEESSTKKIECLRAGADDYMAKPFNPEELEVRIEKQLYLVRTRV